MLTLPRRMLVLVGVLLAAALAVVVVPKDVMGRDETDLAKQEALRREMVARVINEVFIPGDFEMMDKYFSEDYIAHSPSGDLDREGTKNFLSALRSALTDFEATGGPMVVEGDLVATHGVFSGDFTREFSGPMGIVQPNNKRIALEFVNILRFDKDAMVVEEWVQFDTLALLSQLGALPAS